MRRAWLAIALAIVALLLGRVVDGPAVGGVTGELEHLSPVVFVVAFPRDGAPPRDYEAMSRQHIDDLADATRYHG